MLNCWRISSADLPLSSLDKRLQVRLSRRWMLRLAARIKSKSSGMGTSTKSASQPDISVVLSLRYPTIWVIFVMSQKATTFFRVGELTFGTDIVLSDSSYVSSIMLWRVTIIFKTVLSTWNTGGQLYAYSTKPIPIIRTRQLPFLFMMRLRRHTHTITDSMHSLKQTFSMHASLHFTYTLAYTLPGTMLKRCDSLKGDLSVPRRNPS
eukprot:03589_4